MYNAFQLALKYGRYYLTSANGKGHGIHSPFVYDFIREVLIDKKNYSAYSIAEEYRKKLLHDHQVIEVQDFGAGSASGKTTVRSISQIARFSVKPKRYSRLLYRIAAYYQYQQIIELGTSLGVTTTYLGKVPELRQLLTLEGAPAIADHACKQFKDANLGQVMLITGNFDQTLDRALDAMQTVDLAFIDGNHRKKPTLEYFHKIKEKTNDLSCIIFDDIHWSREMEEAWEEIKKDPQVSVSIDLFFLGIVFFRRAFLEKQDFAIRF